MDKEFSHAPSARPFPIDVHRKNVRFPGGSEWPMRELDRLGVRGRRRPKPSRRRRPCWECRRGLGLRLAGPAAAPALPSQGRPRRDRRPNALHRLVFGNRRPGDRLGRGRADGRADGTPQRALCDDRREGAGIRRHHCLVRRCGVDTSQSTRSGGRHRRQPRTRTRLHPGRRRRPFRRGAGRRVP